MVKKIIALALVLGVIGAMVGCSGDTGPAPASGGTAANAGAANGTAGAGTTG